METYPPLSLAPFSYYFNPLHREGGDCKQLFPQFNMVLISIHSTARVETWMTCISALLPEFQSTPPRGWRPGSLLHFPILCNFNPLHREGGDHLTVIVASNPRISIHSTARVETVAHHHGDIDWDNFNPLHREGGDISRWIRDSLR